MTDTIPAAPQPAQVTVPVKPATESVSVWASMAVFLLGIATQFGLPQEIADVMRANSEQLIGAVMTILGVIGAFGALRRKSVLKF